MLNYNRNDIKKGITGILVLIAFLLYNYLGSLPLYLLGIDVDNMSIFSKIMYSLSTEIVFTLIIIYIYKDELKVKWHDAVKNNKKYFDIYFKYWIILLILMLTSNYLISLLMPDSIPANEETIRTILGSYPIYMFISAVFIAPILEELTFRLSFRYMFKSNILLIFMSGLMFGSIHVLSSAESLMELLYIIPYSIPGFVFAYVLTKSDNIFVPMGMHFIHNGILISLQILVLFLS
ncbi:MAG: type II CAAX endopeptidase family protein [Bacilli bacterium]|nr:type II CAAX endopeptidase family protein [Bacilli bacterium]